MIHATLGLYIALACHVLTAEAALAGAALKPLRGDLDLQAHGSHGGHGAVTGDRAGPPTRPDLGSRREGEGGQRARSGLKHRLRSRKDAHRGHQAHRGHHQASVRPEMVEESAGEANAAAASKALSPNCLATGFDPSMFPKPEDGVLIIIPGLGQRERAALVLGNLAWVRAQGIPFRCVIYVYVSEIELPMPPQVYAPCLIIRNKGYWMNHLKAVPLPSIFTLERVVVWLDAVVIDKTGSLRSILSTMSANCLHSMALTDAPASPHHASGNLMQHPGIGRVSDYAETLLQFYTKSAFICYQGLLDPVVNPHGDLLRRQSWVARHGVADEAL